MTPLAPATIRVKCAIQPPIGSEVHKSFCATNIKVPLYVTHGYKAYWRDDSGQRWFRDLGFPTHLIGSTVGDERIFDVRYEWVDGELWEIYTTISKTVRDDDDPL